MILRQQERTFGTRAVQKAFDFDHGLHRIAGVGLEAVTRVAGYRNFILATFHAYKF